MNKKQFILGLMLIFSALTFGQVGIGTTQPKSTFDVSGKPSDAAVVDGITVPRLSGNQLKDKDAVYGTDQTGTLIYATAAASPTTSKTANVTAAGYYYFDGAVWQKAVTNADIRAENGLKKNTTNGAVELGGDLNGETIIATTISGTTHPLRITGLPEGDSEDYVVVSGFGTGQLKMLPQANLGSANIYKNNGTVTAGANRMVTIPDATNLNFNGQDGANIFHSTDFGEIGSIAYENGGKISLATEGNNGDITISTIGATGSNVLLQASSGTRNVGIGTQTPSNKLHVSATSDPLRLQGLQNGTSSDNILTVSSTGIVKQTTIENFLNENSIQTSAVFELTNNFTNFLNGVSAGSKQTLPMTLVKNVIPGLTFNSGTNTITFPPGLYQMTFVYDAIHNATNCTISSYIIDFPSSPSNTRIHNTAAHNQGGSITYTSRISESTNWVIQLGRGASGNCTGTGNDLYAKRTQITIVRIGD
jgi:hypothetical protein